MHITIGKGEFKRNSNWYRPGLVPPGMNRSTRLRGNKGSDLGKLLRSKDCSQKDINNSVVTGKSKGSGNERKYVDWLDQVLLSHMEELAAIAQVYYGNHSMDKLYEMARRMTTKKDTGISRRP